MIVQEWKRIVDTVIMLLAKKKREKELSTKVNILNTPFLVIVESPSKCSKIEHYLGFQYKCIASKGHIRELKSVVSKTFEPEFVLIKEKESHATWMKTIVSSFSPANIFIGTDDDREGEGIAWHICKICNLDVNTTKRILFHEVTQSALKSAIGTPGLIRMNIVHAQQARQILDRMIGFQISPVLSRLVQHDHSIFLSAGRCQTPTLRLIYDRHLENSAKQEKLQYKIQGSFFDSPSTIVATLNKEYDGEEECIRFLDKSKTFSHMLTLKSTKEKKTGPPQPFNTSGLLQFVSNTLHMSPKHIMDCCQSLYQEGHITYMRTESKLYANGFLSQMNDFITDEFGGEHVSSEIKLLENSDSNNPHEAIRVTHLQTRAVDHTDKKVMDVYKLIWNRTIQSCMSHYRFNETDVTITAPNDTHYKSIIEIPVFIGWKRIAIMTPDEMNSLRERSTAQVQYIDTFNQKRVVFNKVECTLHMRDLDKYYTEASLIQKLETLGIGRPSTYSMLIDTIQERKYIKKENIEGETITGNEFKLTREKMIMETSRITKTFGSYKNKLRIQPLGVESICLLSAHFSELFDYTYTSKMESGLDKLVEEDSLVNWSSLLQTCDDTIKSCTDPLKRKMGTAYSIDETHELVYGKSGPMIKVKGEKTYKPLKHGVEVEFGKLEREEYKLADLMDVVVPCLGVYNGENVYVKTGPFGPYVSCGDKTVSIKSLNSKNMTLETVSELLVNKTKQEDDKPASLRELNEYTSVRKSKFGNYIYLKTDKMKKPIFINIKKCPYDVLTEDIETLLTWVQQQKHG